MKKIVKSVKNVGADDSVRPMLQGNTMAKQNGITLVALVITIILLILLAVVSINIVQNSELIEKTKLAKEEHRASAIQEQIDLFKNEQEIAKQNNETEPSINELIDKLQEQNLITAEEKNTIMQTGKVTIASKEITFSTDAILPQGYTRCEYLESTGTQYIDTEHAIQLNEYVELDIFLTNVLKEIKGIAGWVETADIRYDINTGENSDIRLVYTKNGKMSINSIVATSSVYNNWLNISSKGFKMEEYKDYNFYLFRRNYNKDSPRNDIKIKSYKVKTYDDKLVQNLIPCLDSNNRPCMYDTVSGQTFYNQGTGEFIAGPVIE